MPQKRWARARQTGAHGLRRGAWYLLVNDPGGSLIILNVRKHNIPVPRTMVVVSDDSPERWSVVRWDEYQLGVQTASQKGTGLMYVVCPKCGARKQIDPPKAAQMTCDQCQGGFPVNWDEYC
jgi:hypothetical protein